MDWIHVAQNGVQCRLMESSGFIKAGSFWRSSVIINFSSETLRCVVSLFISFRQRN
jgi:hypothetical protein